MAGSSFSVSQTVYEDSDNVFSLPALLAGRNLPPDYWSTIDTIVLKVFDRAANTFVTVAPTSEVYQLIDSADEGTTPDILRLNFSKLADFFGNVSIRIELSDSKVVALPDIINLGVSVVSVNDAPSGADKTIDVPPATTYVLAAEDFGFSDPVERHNFKSVLIDTLPALGQLQLNGAAVAAGQEILAADIAAGNLSFVADAGTRGSLTLSFRVRDDGGINSAENDPAKRGSDTDLTANTLTFKVNAANLPPQALNDASETNRDTPVSIDVLGNDSDPDGGRPSLIGVGQGAQGQVRIDEKTGNAIYTPNAGFVGSDQFSYTIADSLGETATATVSVQVKAVNQVPAALPSVVAGTEDANYVFSPADFKSSDPDTADSITSIFVENLPADGRIELLIGGQWTAVTAGQTIGITDVAAGSLRFVPDLNESSAPCDAPGIGNFRQDYASFDFAVLDSLGAKSAAAPMVIDIAPVADAPTLTVPGSPINGLQETAIHLIGISAALTDTDGSEKLGLIIGAIPVGAVLSDGTNKFTAAAGSTTADVTGWNLTNLSLTPPAGFTGKITLDVKATATENCNNDQASTNGSLTLNVEAPPKPAIIGNRVWEDKDADGIQDAGEAGMNGVTVQLKDASGAVVQSVVTSGDGNYSFSAAPGTYTVAIVKPESFLIVSPKDQGGNDNLDSDFDPATTASGPITVVAGQTIDNLDAGLYCKAQVGDRVWLDANRNGIQDTGESGIAGVTVQLKNAAGTVIATQRTDSDGYYNFINLDAGQYSIQFVAPKNYVFTTPNIGSDLTDSDARLAGKSTTNLIVNGSFEDPRPLLGISTHYTSISGWTGSGDKLEIGGGSNYGVSGVTGSQVLELDAQYTLANIKGVATGVYQDVATKAGQSYELSLDVAMRLGTLSSTNTVEVWWRDAKIATIDPTSTKFQTYTFNVQGSGGKDRLEFREQAVDDNGLGGIIDNVRMYALTAEGSTDGFTLENCQIVTSVDAGLYKIPVNATIEGAGSIYEGKSGSYSIKLDRALDTDTFYTVKVTDGTAFRVDQYAGNQDIIWGGYYNYWDGSKWVNVYNRVPNGNTLSAGDRPSVGPADGSWDYTVYNDAGQINTGDTITVKVAAGQTVSESFSVQAWQEKVTIDKDIYPKGYSEGTENFQLSISASTGSGDINASGPLTVSIYDTTTYATVSPIVIDLNGDGIHTTALGETSGKFDLLNDGNPVETGWLSGQDGFLAIDASGNGRIDNRSELFGGTEGEGFAKLARFDSNGDRLVNAGDERFDELRIWQDVNENHQTDSGELKSLADAGIAELRVDYTLEASEQNGNHFLEHSTATLADGTAVDMVDVYFNIAAIPAGTAGTAAGAAPAMDGSVLEDGTEALDDLLAGLSDAPPMESCIEPSCDTGWNGGTSPQSLQSLIDLNEQTMLLAA